ncbi:MAG TPA: nuclear transport factor 2 family protein [Acidimicrobiales bacterium]|nr:nuclear transport factor 2 family protein [Acidimicrobiales bacterium]
MSGTVERFFEHLSARDWASLSGVLAPEVERVGPFGDRVSGRDRYLAMLEEAVPAVYRNDVHLVTYAADRRAAFARLTEHLGYPDQTLHLEEAYAFELDAGGLVRRIEVFWQTPQYKPTAGSS